MILLGPARDVAACPDGSDPAAPAGPGAVRGACPTVHDPFAAVDGALVRVRVPLGELGAAQLRVVAAAARRGNGIVELTSRANLQLRGLPDDALAAVAAQLAAAGLAPAERRRGSAVDLLISPTAGDDPLELLDTRALASSVLAVLASRPHDLASLPPKFGLLIDGGGTPSLRGRRHDLCLGARRTDAGDVAFELQLGRALPMLDTPGEPIVLVSPTAAAELVAAVVSLCAQVRARVADLVDAHGRDALVARLEALVGMSFPRQTAGGGRWPAAVAPVGTLASPGDAPTSPVSVGAAAELGRVDPDTLDRLADLAERHGRCVVRLTPWRGVVVPGITPDEADAAVAALMAAGLVCDRRDPALAVVACAGSTGCASGLADTQADGRRLIDHLRATPLAHRPASVHLSGCPKRCATRDATEVTLIAGPRPGTYQSVGPQVRGS